MPSQQFFWWVLRTKKLALKNTCFQVSFGTFPVKACKIWIFWGRRLLSHEGLPYWERSDQTPLENSQYELFTTRESKFSESPTWCVCIFLQPLRIRNYQCFLKCWFIALSTIHLKSWRILMLDLFKCRFSKRSSFSCKEFEEEFWLSSLMEETLLVFRKFLVWKDLLQPSHQSRHVLNLR